MALWTKYSAPEEAAVPGVKENTDSEVWGPARLLYGF